MSETRQTMIGLTKISHGKLKTLKENGVFNEMADGYRTGIALAIAMDMNPTPITENRVTIFSVATIDNKQEISTIVKSLLGVSSESIYTIIEQLAEIGIKKLYAEYEENGNIDFISMLKQLSV